MDSKGLFDAVQSHALSLGLFDSVNTHEPKNAPGNQIVCAIYLGPIRPVNSSGLASTSGVVTFILRVYKSMLAEPQDAIDPDLLNVVDKLFAAYSGDFELGGSLGLRCVDLLGMSGEPLSARPGFLTYPEGGTYRTVDVTLPLIINDMWTQAP